MIQLSEWAHDLLASRNALVESEAGSPLRAILPPEIAKKLGVSDWLSLDFGTRAGADDATEWLERLSTLLPPSPMVVGARLRERRQAGRIDAASVLHCGLVIQNGVWRGVEDYAETAPYYWFSFQYAVESDERSIGYVTVGLNGRSRAGMEQPERLLCSLQNELEEDRSFTLPSEQLRGLYPVAARTAETEVRARLVMLEQSANRRLVRDSQRMESYYRGLLTHMEKRAARRSTDPEAADKEHDRMVATRLDRAAKLEDLVRKYSLRVQLGLTQVLVVPLPVRAISVRLIRKKQERPMLLHWNAISRALDTPLCEACSARARPLYLCEKVHLLCGACWSPCPECSRVFCRACQPRCKCAPSS